jgi:hypothetical protein
MALRTYANPKVLSPKTVANLKKAILVEVTASTSDTITVAELAAITSVAVFNATSGAVVTATVLTNVITITELALTSVKLIVLAIG